MKLSSRVVTIFGLSLTIPMFYVIRRALDKHRAAILRAHRQEMGDCERCHKLLSNRAGISMLMHMQEHHKIEPDDSYEIIADLYRRLWTAHQEGRK